MDNSTETLNPIAMPSSILAKFIEKAAASANTDDDKKLFLEAARRIKCTALAVTDTSFEHALQCRFKMDGALWEVCTYSMGRTVEALRDLAKSNRKDYPQYEWRVVTRENSDWWPEDDDLS